jgi:hypothetical protein
MGGQDEYLREFEAKPMTTDEEGALAFIHGIKEINCPYSPGSLEYDDWLRGFRSMSRQLGGFCRKGTCSD